MFQSHLNFCWKVWCVADRKTRSLYTWIYNRYIELKEVDALTEILCVCGVLHAPHSIRNAVLHYRLGFVIWTQVSLSSLNSGRAVPESLTRKQQFTLLSISLNLYPFTVHLWMYRIPSYWRVMGKTLRLWRIAEKERKYKWEYSELTFLTSPSLVFWFACENCIWCFLSDKNQTLKQ